MISYLVIALSFAISSYYFIHVKHVKRKLQVRYFIAYILLATLIFPILFLSWVLDPEGFCTGYSKKMRELLDE